MASAVKVTCVPPRTSPIVVALAVPPIKPSVFSAIWKGCADTFAVAVVSETMEKVRASAVLVVASAPVMVQSSALSS